MSKIRPIPDLRDIETILNGTYGFWVNYDDNTCYHFYGGIWNAGTKYYPERMWTPDKESRYDRLVVPFELSHLVCTCKKGDRKLRPVHKDDESRSLQVKCLTCGLYAKYLLLKCDSCDEHYFNTFRHPYKCLLKRLCWECIEQLDEPLCSDEHIAAHPYANCEWVRKYRNFEKEAPEYVDMTERSREFSLDNLDFDF